MSPAERTWAWLAQFAAHVRAREVDEATAMFDPDCVSFGTHAERVDSRDELSRRQWTPIWTTTEGFEFERDSLVVQDSPEAGQLVAIVGWRSTGIDSAGHRFARRGRATIVLIADDQPGSCLRATHTHFSETPTPP